MPDDRGRHALRIKDYDYSKAGAYFIMICSNKRDPLFSIYANLKMIIEKQWQNLSRRYNNIILDEHIIMPEHFHGIVFLMDIPVGATFTVARAGTRPAPTIGEIIGSFKSLCYRDWKRYCMISNPKAPLKIWQRTYYEHIIRDEDELRSVREYIRNNELKRAFRNG
jgi:putative transposase